MSVCKKDKQKHIKTDSEVKQFKCVKECGRSFSTSETLVKHLRTAHLKQKAYKCAVCSKDFSKKSHLITHLTVHSNEKPFKCTKCHMQFGDKSNLNRHLRDVHLKKKPHQCPECDKSFAQKSSLIIHSKVHTEEKSFKCTKCLMDFRFKSNLDRHFRNVHLKLKLHQCTKCEECFSEKSTLVQHLRVHTGEKPYVCNICSLTFTHLGNRNRHVKAHLRVLGKNATAFSKKPT